MKIFLAIVLILILLIVTFWIGLKIKPPPFQSISQEPAMLQTIPLPSGLPLPVEKFYRKVYGDQIPVIHSAIISGYAQLTLPNEKGITFPSRFRFIHKAGYDYYHHIEVTLFGFPIVKVHEYFIDGKGIMYLPFGTFQGDTIDQSANLGLWAESIWMPALFITDPRIAWEPIDETTAVLVVPYKTEKERFIVRFDPNTGLIQYMEAMRYRGGEESAVKTLWITESKDWSNLNGFLLPKVGEVTWFGTNKPWAVFTIEQVIYNTDVKPLLANK